MIPKKYGKLKEGKPVLYKGTTGIRLLTQVH